MIAKTLLLLFISLWASLSSAIVVYRADNRDPATIKRSGGFLSKGTSKVGTVAPDISLWNHVNGAANGFSRDNDGYTSTTTSLTFAESWALNQLGGNGYVYRISVAPNMVDVQEILKQYNPYPDEKEYAVLGGIPYDQIIGWSRVANRKILAVEKNKDFNKRRYSGLKHATGQYQLAAFPPGHRAWSESPWNAHASCSNPRTRAERALAARRTCRPAKSNVQFAQEYARIMFS